MKDEPAFSSVMIFGLYRGALRKAINLLKYHNVKRLSKPLADILLNINTPAIDGILPVPLHRKRLRHREFNQSALLARYVAHNLGVPLIIDCLIKMTDTLPQVGLTSKERKENISNAFGIQDNTLVKGKNIMLIDDVITTGATVRECSKILKKAGAHDIHVVALAHGIRD
jgi:ComF family protein